MNDFLLSETGDLRIENGDLVIGDANQQNLNLMLMLPKGALKEFPDATVGISNYLESEDHSAMLREIRTRLEADGRDVKELTVDGNGKIIINAPYK